MSDGVIRTDWEAVARGLAEILAIHHGAEASLDEVDTLVRAHSAPVELAPVVAEIAPAEEMVARDVAESHELINERTIGLLEDWLEHARAGELREVVLAGIREIDGYEDMVWAASGTLSKARRVGLLEMAKSAYLSATMGGACEDEDDGPGCA